MNCCNCCDNTKNLGCFDPCGIEFVTGANTPIGEAGEWTLYIEFGRRRFKYDNTMIDGQPINFLVGCLNPYYEYTAYVVKPDGTKAVFTIDGVKYDCFNFSTKLQSSPGINAGATLVE